MKRLAILLSFLLPSAVFGAENNPVAKPEAVVVSGNARFTVLTDRLIRMEWAADGVFEDNATLAIVNRNLPVPAFKKSEKGGVLSLKTDKLSLTYKGGRFGSDNLSVKFKMNGKNVIWTPGMEESGNLLGTTRTLDGSDGFEKLSKTETKMENGILSRDGWAIVDESARHLLVKDGSDWGEWVAERSEADRLDLYIFAYGHDYKAALSDFSKVAGKIPLPPKYTLGYWWSRYWIYTDDEIMELAKTMRERQIPIDVFIIDMDWHLTWKELDKRCGHDEFGQRRGWTGYTWNRDLFPDPEGTLKDLHDMGYKTSLNLHPASGIRPLEDCYERFVEDYLSRTDDYDGPKDYVYDGQWQFKGVDKAVGKAGHRAPVPFRLSQQAWADAYFNSVIHPLERQGVDFWWLDWQQWREDRYVKDLSNTFWCNYTFFNDKVRQSKSLGLDAPRPLIYHRWGGLGSHRYQLGFSGDTYEEWKVLAFLPWFTATASNVGYGYWGHDIGGHMQKRDNRHPSDPELFTRWIQYGVFTPIFKTHSTQDANLDRRIWAYPEHYPYMKAAVELRYALTPYIYDAAREAFDSGISICRPLYYEYPEQENAYSWKEEFFFGDKILATALCQPMDKASGKTERKMWFPAGNDWYDMAKHKMLKGGSIQTLYYGIDENPWYVKAGSIIPLAAEGIQNLQDPTDAWRILIIPGNGKSSYERYEDDGLTQNYVNDYATTLITKEASSSRIRVHVAPRKGSYAGAPATRSLSLVFEGVTTAPKKVSVNGAAVSSSLDGTALKVDLGKRSASEELDIIVLR